MKNSEIELREILFTDEQTSSRSEQTKGNRVIYLSGYTSVKTPSNAVKNTKYNPVTFLPLFLFYQFKQPLNMFFLVISLTQFYPPLQVGFLFTYVAPLVLVLTITMGKELYDDLVRWKRDREVNAKLYTKLTSNGKVRIPAKDIKVGHLIEIMSNERIPADMILLKTHDTHGSVFIKTDQLDGETDWKLRKAVACTQSVHNDLDLLRMDASVIAQYPHKMIYEFEGRMIASIDNRQVQEGLSLENTLWANTTLASGSCVGIVVYTGKETRSVMNSREPKNKLGISDIELNRLAMYMLLMMTIFAFLLLALSGFNSNSGVLFFRYVLLLSSIIPISLRVNLDFAKIYYCFNIATDPRVGKAKPRNSTIPEELGRIHILLSDKTGTLTNNDMTLKRISLERQNFSIDEEGSAHEFIDLVHSTFIGSASDARDRRRNNSAKNLVVALSLCHNVSIIEENGVKDYQASSPDEICLVKYAESIGVELVQSSHGTMVLQTPAGIDTYKILDSFPFTSARKRMGIIVQHQESGEIIFYLKGADSVISPLLSSRTACQIMIEECENLAMEGLRTLAITQKILTLEEYEKFKISLDEAKTSMSGRTEKVEECIQSLEDRVEFLGITGMEDKLQDNVDTSIENLRAAGIKVWMLTGDKVETAQCVAISTRIFKNKRHSWFKMIDMEDQMQIKDEFSKLASWKDSNQVIIIDGKTLNTALEHTLKEFVNGCMHADGVVCCRVSPTQKSKIVEAVQKYSSLRVCSIGDGGNDVGMIQSAHIGIGIEGKEGMQASLAADFSISEFQFLVPLMLWHGRLSYLRTGKMANFVFHRGFIIAMIQMIFCLIFYYVAIPIYNGYLILGYTTIFTSMPVFSLVLDRDSDFETVKRNANFYLRIQQGRALNLLRFLVWIWKSLYQGSVIILLAIVLFPNTNYVNIVAITFSALVLTELLNIATVIQTWNRWIFVSEIATLTIYVVSIVLLKNYFDLDFIANGVFFMKVIIITLCSWFPLHISSKLKDYWFPDEGRKVRA